MCVLQDQPAKLNIIEVGKDKTAPGGVFRLAPVDLPVAADAAADFPVAMKVCVFAWLL